MIQAAVQNTPAPGASAQTAAPGAPAPTAAPELPPAITAASPSGTVFTMPRTAGEMRAMRNMRSELSDQLQSAAGRREDLAKEIITADPASRAGLQSRIDLLDQRILQIEQDIATTGALVARAQGQFAVSGTPDNTSPFSRLNMNMTPIGILFTLFVLAPIAITVARTLWRRGNLRSPDAGIERENTERLIRLEQSVDTIAVEMERVSEGQRFVTKLLADAAKRDNARIAASRE